jgi:hypothetical protein
MPQPNNYGLAKLIDPLTAILKKNDNTIQAYNLQDLPTNFHEFIMDWSKWEHGSSNFKTITLKNGWTKGFNGIIPMGSDYEPQDLLSLAYLILDDLIPHGGGKVEFHYKELQAVNTKWDLILFGVPADVDTLAFHDMIMPFFRKAMG